MEEQEQEMEQNNQPEQTGQDQNDPNRDYQNEDTSEHRTGIIPDDDLEGSDADSDELLKDTEESTDGAAI